jgi:hypothetical protein
MLGTALEFLRDPTDQKRILARESACIAEYVRLVDARMSTTMSVGEADATAR